MTRSSHAPNSSRSIRAVRRSPGAYLHRLRCGGWEPSHSAPSETYLPPPRNTTSLCGQIAGTQRVDLLWRRAPGARRDAGGTSIVGDGPALDTCGKERSVCRALFFLVRCGARNSRKILRGRSLCATQDRRAGGATAMNFALPVIVAEADGTQEDLVRTENGWRVTPGHLDELTKPLLWHCGILHPARDGLESLPHRFPGDQFGEVVEGSRRRSCPRSQCTPEGGLRDACSAGCYGRSPSPAAGCGCWHPRASRSISFHIPLRSLRRYTFTGGPPRGFRFRFPAARWILADWKQTTLSDEKVRSAFPFGVDGGAVYASTGSLPIYKIRFLAL